MTIYFIFSQGYARRVNKAKKWNINNQKNHPNIYINLDESKEQKNHDREDTPLDEDDSNHCAQVNLMDSGNEYKNISNPIKDNIVSKRTIISDIINEDVNKKKFQDVEAI